MINVFKLAKRNFESVEAKTERNMELISVFVEHVKEETTFEIPEEVILDFFNA